MTQTIIILLTLVSFDLHARPEYQLNQKVECSSCHVRPWGGGARTSFGKIVGYRGATVIEAPSDLYSADVRMLAFYTKKAITKRSGFALMSTEGSVNVPVRKTEAGTALNLVAGYDLGWFVVGPRDVYAKWTFSHNNFLTVGRFVPPFGLMTDEHRTFTRLATQTSLLDYEMGAVSSTQWFNTIHVDVALTNGASSGGALTDGELTWAYFANLRWNPAGLPFFLGVSSLRHHYRVNEKIEPQASSFYGGLRLNDLTFNLIKGTLTFEGVQAKDFNNPDRNPAVGKYFIPEKGFENYLTEVQDSTSQAAMVALRIDAKLFDLVYRYDNFLLDKEFEGDAYAVQGYGIDMNLAGHTNLILKHEKAEAGREGIDHTNSLAARGGFIMVLHTWL